MWKSLLSMGAAAVVLAACNADLAAPPPRTAEPSTLGAAYVVPTVPGINPAGMSNYCSKVFPATAGWSFNYTGNDPCTAVAGGTVVRAGMYSTSGLNKVLVWCNPNYIWAFDGYGRAPLDQAYNAAATTKAHWGGCIFTVAPAAMPIFDWPFDPNGSYPANYHGSGFDFERPPYGAAGKVVDYRGLAVSFINDHDAHDFGMVPGTPLHAVADGVIIVAGMYKGIYTNCRRVTGQPNETGQPDCGEQGIIIVRHTAKASKPQYDETFATGYFHVQQVAAGILANCTRVDLTKGVLGEGGVCAVPVTKGQVIGYSGRRSTNAGHLHFATWRLSNTSRKDSYGYRAPDQALHVPSCCNTGNAAIGPTLITEPYGWRPSPTTDPWAYGAREASAPYPNGAGTLSIRLWKVDPPIHW